MIDFADGRWKRKLVGAAPSAELARDLEGAPIEDASYPAAAKVTGQITSTLAEVEVLPAETIVTIRSAGEFGGTMREEGGDMAFTMKLQVTERRSLERAVEIDGSGQGTLEISGSYVEDGMSVALSMAGPITIKVKGAVL